MVNKHQIDAHPEEVLSQNTYNDLGQVTNKKVGNNLQSIDYAYNIGGSIVKVNNPSNLNGKLFGYEIKYENPVNTSLSAPRYNGNIAEIDWRTSNDNVLRRYNYQYDDLNRLNKGLYSEPNSSVPENGFYNEEISYDIAGSISNLKRNTNSFAGTALQIDNLTYAYEGNRLTSVTDTSGNYGGYPDVGGNTIAYDANGNMKNQIDKGILNIDYNFLNLPKEIKHNESYIIRNPATGEDEERNVRTAYTYRADGTKLRKKHTTFFSKGSSERISMTDYLDGFQYTVTHLGAVSLEFVPTSEGYYNFKNNKYIYSYTDHLGNVRLSYFNNGSGAEALEENNYYPYGLKHEGNNQLTGNTNYNYQYNGKELQTETGMYDYGARMYMPDIGQWGVIDPLAESYRRHSPYHYAMNNPVKFTDPDGMGSYDENGEWRSELEDYWNYHGYANGPTQNSYASYNSLVNNGGSGSGGSENTIYNLFDGQGVGFSGVYAQQLFNYFLDNLTASGELDFKGFHFVLEDLTPTIYKFTLTAFQMGKPSILHYDGDKERVSARRKQNVHAMKTVSGYQRDEYPYASTLEGDNAMVTYVPSRENSIQGGTLGAMYRASGLKTGDAFLVLPVPHGNTKEKVKQDVMERMKPEPVRSFDFSRPAVPYKAWPVLMGAAVVVGLVIYSRFVPAIP